MHLQKHRLSHFLILLTFAWTNFNIEAMLLRTCLNIASVEKGIISSFIRSI